MQCIQSAHHGRQHARVKGCLTTGRTKPPGDYDRWRELVYEWAKRCVERRRRGEDMAFADVSEMASITSRPERTARPGGKGSQGGHMPKGTTRNGSSVARLSLLLTVALAVPAWSQVQTGRIVGTVRDPQQATVPKATVTVTASATGQSVTVTTNDRGDYVVTPVNPGRYQVTVAVQGFQTAVVNAVEVPVGQSVRVDVELQAGRALRDHRGDRRRSPPRHGVGHARPQRDEHPDRRPAPQRPQLLRAGAPDPGGGRPAGRREPRADPRQLHLRHRHQRRAGQPAHLPDRRRGRDRPPSGRLLHPDLGRRPPGVQGPAERLLRRVQPGGRHAERRHQVRGAASSTAGCSSSCATTSSTPPTSS